MILHFVFVWRSPLPMWVKERLAHTNLETRKNKVWKLGGHKSLGTRKHKAREFFFEIYFLCASIFKCLSTKVNMHHSFKVCEVFVALQSFQKCKIFNKTGVTGVAEEWRKENPNSHFFGGETFVYSKALEC